MGWRQIYLPGGGGTGGPGISDAFSIRFALPDTIGGQGDGTSFAFVFPETVAGQADAVQFRVVLPDTVPIQTDVLASLRLAINETIAGMTEGVSLRIVAPDTIPGQTDAGAYTMRTTITDTSPSQADVASVALRVPESLAGTTDDSRFTIRPTYGDSNTAPADAGQLGLRFAESSAGQTDSQATTRRSGCTAATTVQGGIPSSETVKATGYPNHPDYPANVDAQWMCTIQHQALQAQPIVDVHTPNVPTAGYVAGSVEVYTSWWCPTVTDTHWLEFVRHDGTVNTLITSANDSTHYGISPSTWLRVDDPAGTAAQQALRTYLSTATVAQINACKVRFRSQGTTQPNLNPIYVDAVIFVTKHS